MKMHSRLLRGPLSQIFEHVTILAEESASRKAVFGQRLAKF